jgi:hypothetical protein
MLNTYFKFMIFKAKNTFAPKAFKHVVKMDFAKFSSFSKKKNIIKILSNFEKIMKDI